MVKFEIIEETIELVYYSQDTTLPELVAKLEEFRLENQLKTKNCMGCGICCQDNIPVLGLDLPILAQGLNCCLDELIKNYLILPEPINTDSRRKSIEEMAKLNKISLIDAILLYEYNNAEPLILNKQANGDCCLLEVIENYCGNMILSDKLSKVQERPRQKLCSLYKHRPYSCGLYLCNMGEKLSFIQEMIIRQGTWHAYNKLGWISEEEIQHNPFLQIKSYDSLLVKDFDYQLQDTLDQLFFYF